MQVELSLFETRLLQMAVEGRIETLKTHLAEHDYAVHKYPDIVKQADEAYLDELHALWNKLELAQR